MTGHRSILAALVLGALAVPALAQPSEATRRADQLFQEGRKLLDAGDAAAACPKFEESQRLDPGLGTLLNLADCYERTGRLASALTAFRSAEEQARTSGEKKREQAAADRARALEGRVARVTITLAPGDRPPGFEVRRGGAVVAALDLGRPIAVDPGTVTIEATAPGYAPFQRSLTVGNSASRLQLDIPVLAPVDGPPPDDHDPHDRPPPPPPPDHTPDATPAVTRVDPGAGRRRIAYAVGGAGVVGLGAGVAVGLIARGRYRDADCPDGVCVDQAALDKANAARRLGNIGTIVGVVGAAAAATGVVLWLTAPRAHAVEIAPSAGPDGAGVTVFGRF